MLCSPYMVLDAVFQLNSAQFVFPESDEMEHEQRESFASCLLTLRLLAKFLGLVAFLPYQAPERLPDAMQSSFITMRNQVGTLSSYVGYVVLLGKFMGLVMFLPYQASERLPDAMQSSFITMKNQVGSLSSYVDLLARLMALVVFLQLISRQEDILLFISKFSETNFAKFSKISFLGGRQYH